MDKLVFTSGQYLRDVSTKNSSIFIVYRFEVLSTEMFVYFIFKKVTIDRNRNVLENISDFYACEYVHSIFSVIDTRK